MTHAFEPVSRQSLADDVAQRISQLIQAGGYAPMARLPSISRMARDFGVGGPTLREALKRLEALGIVSIRHGSGVYVGQSPAALLITNPVVGLAPTRKLLIDLIDARITIELQTTALAARNASAEHLDEMDRLLRQASRSFDAATLNQVTLSFHRQIALASGNVVMHQILEVLSSLFRREQALILDIHGHGDGHGDADHAEHVEIYQALRARDADLASGRMRRHLERVKHVLQNASALAPAVN